MKPINKLLAGAIVAATIAGAAPANAEVVTFAQFQSIGNKGQTYWKNNGTNASNGTGGSIFTTSTATSTVPGSRLVRFSFVQPSISPFVTNVNANFTLLGSVTNSPATLASGQLIQSGITGTFSFLTTSALTINSRVFAAGSNLLSGSFTNASITGQRLGTSGSFGGSGSQGTTFTYTSDFLDFIPASSLDFSIAFTSISSALQASPSGGVPNRALRSFRAFSTGSFSSDPAPIVTAVPEPAVWGLMVIGFGLVGVRKRGGARVVTA